LRFSKAQNDGAAGRESPSLSQLRPMLSQVPGGQPCVLFKRPPHRLTRKWHSLASFVEGDFLDNY
jgi:hypothetical protein